MNDLAARMRGVAKAATDNPDWDTINADVMQWAVDLYFRFKAVTLGAGLTGWDAHVGTDGQGGIVFQWWKNDHTYNLYVKPNGDIFYLTAWGADMGRQMESGGLAEDADIIASWGRFTREEKVPN